MRGRKEVEGFSPWDLDNLRNASTRSSLRGKIAKGSEEAENIASALIIAYQHGVRDRAELIRLGDKKSH